MDLMFSIKPEARSSAERDRQGLRRFKGRGSQRGRGRRGARDLGAGEIRNTG